MRNSIEVQLPPVRQREPRAATVRERRRFPQFVKTLQAGVESAGIANWRWSRAAIIEPPPQRFSPSGRLSWTANAERSGTLPEYDPLADLYDLEYVHDYDVPFWLALAERENGPVVEWGAGTGRIAAPLAAAGHDVTAVELSEAMVERGRKKGDGVRWVAGDMRTARLDRRYGLAFCAFNSFLCLLTPGEGLAFLRNARGHLKPGGLLGIEVSAFSPEELAEDPTGPSLRHDLTRGLPDGGRLDRFSLSRYDAASQIMEMRLFYEASEASGGQKSSRAHDLAIRIANRDELLLMLRLAGLGVEAVYGGFGAEPFTAGSDHLIVLARR